MRVRIGAFVCAIAVLALGTASVTVARSPGSASAAPQVISDSQLSASTTTIGGAKVLRTTRTVAHWYGQTLNPDNGVTYGYNMVGADPNNCTGTACDATIQARISR